MRWFTAWNKRLQSILAFSFLSAYVLSFLFEGQILYSLLGFYDMSASSYIILAIVAHFLGLLTSGFLIKSPLQARSAMCYGLGVALITIVPFFFAPSLLWQSGLIIGGYASGAAIAAWGYFLKVFTEKRDRLKTCADVLITSNILMIIINVISSQLSPFIGLMMVMFALIIGMVLTWGLSVDTDHQETEKRRVRASGELKNAFLLLCLFIAVLTINSGLMYVVINPAFEHLTTLVSWYWSVPYLVALVVMRNPPQGFKHSRMLYAGMAMIVGAFIAFMLLGRHSLDYLVINTLLLGACGVFDLFWWSILGNMLDYIEKPSMIFGIGLSANVLGVLSGGLIGMVAKSSQILTAKIAVMGMLVVCITLGILPLLNRELVILLKSHAYLVTYDTLGESQQSAILYQTASLDPLTIREQEVLEQMLSGMSNREIAATLYIKENTVKTHARNIYSKYAVHSRAELISILLKGNDS